MGRLTGLFGTNSSGKTSLLQLLLLLKQTVDSPDRSLPLNLGDDRSLVSLGPLREILHQRRAEQGLAWRIEWSQDQVIEVHDPQISERPLIKEQALAFDGEITEGRSGQASVKRFVYEVGGREFGMSRKSPSKYELFASGKDFRFRRTAGRPADLPPPTKCYGFPEQARGRYQNTAFLSDLELAFEQLFNRVHYLGPLRDYPHREYTWAGARPSDMGRRGEKAVDALLAAQSQTISLGRGTKAPTVEEYVARWLERLGLIDSFAIKPVTEGGNLYRVLVRCEGSPIEVLITDVGFGVSQILPVLALCFSAPRGSILILEQPEIHLHPSVQAGLADLLLDAIKKRDLQIILESHSEHLLRRLQRRIAEDEVSRDDVSLYFCELIEGTSRLSHLELDPFGNIRNWPSEFFGDEFAEIAAMNRAAAAKRVGR